MGGFVGEVVSFIGRPFGVYTHDETFTDIQISNLLTPGEADKNARRNAKHNSGGNANTYMAGYKAFQRDYRKKYSAQFMRRQGYAPSSTAFTRINDPVKTEVYLEGLYGYVDITVESVKDKYLTINEKGRHAIQTLAGYDFTTGNVIDGGTYILTEYTEDTVNETVVVRMRRDYIESIEYNLYTNYAYDGTEVTILGEQYTVGTISDTLTINDEYETVCTHVGGTLPDEIIVTAAERKAYEVTNVSYGTEASYASYRVTSGEVGSELRYWVDIADSQDIYIRASVDITAIIPMKEDNAMVNLENGKLQKMLGKLNLSGEELKSSIENPDMDSAYLMTGINPQYNDNTTNTALLKIFDYIAEAGANITISISRLSMRYSFGMSKNTIQGSIGPVGTATRTNIARILEHTETVPNYVLDPDTNTMVQNGTTVILVPESNAGMILRLQVDSNEYREITVTDFVQEYTISGHVLTSYLDSTGGYARIVIPLDILNGFNYKTFVEVYEKSLCMLAFSVTVVRVRWYETAAFGTLLKIVAIAIFILTVGSGGGISAALMSLATSMAILYVTSLIAKAIGGTFGAIVGAIAAIAAMYYNPFGVGLSDTELWLQMANQTIGVINQSVAMKMDEIIANSEAFMKEMAAKFEELDKLMEEYKDINSYGYTTLNSDYAGKPSQIFVSIEDYCAGILESADISNLIDYSKQIEYNISTRNNVVAGIA